MDKSHSRLLQVVIALTLFNVAPDGRTATYNGEPVTVVGTYIDEPTFQPYIDYWDPSLIPPERRGSNGIDDGTDETDDADGENDEEKAKECAAIAAKVDATCDLENPPIAVANGCGSGFTTALVPDYLMVGTLIVYRLGPIFRDACNMHDKCYGTYPGDKNACDMVLHNDMIKFAKLHMSSSQWTIYNMAVRAQAYAYSAGLQSPFIEPFSGAAFSAAQKDGMCRFYSTKASEAGCFE